MGGTGGHPPDFTYRKVKYRKFGGEPPVPPIASRGPPAFIYFIKDATYAPQPLWVLPTITARYKGIRWHHGKI